MAKQAAPQATIQAPAPAPAGRAGGTPTPAEALAMLMAGNARFISGDRQHPHQDADHRKALAPGQQPFAVVFGCSDSRLAAEIIFDQGLGDMFVVRTAGHVVGPEVLGSVEYGVAVLDVPLIVVLGHDSCGAVAATLRTLSDGVGPEGFMREIVERVMISVLASGGNGNTSSDAAIAEHVRYTVQMLSERSSVIAERIADGRCAVVGLTYRLAEGNVEQVAAIGL
jgi:carbonic anhydrase